MIDPMPLGPAPSFALSRPGAFSFIGDPRRYHQGAAATLAPPAARLEPATTRRHA